MFYIMAYLGCSYMYTFMDSCMIATAEKKNHHALQENRLHSALSIFSSDVAQIPFSYTIVSRNHHSQCSCQLTALSFCLSFSPPHQKKQFLLARKNANACLVCSFYKARMVEVLMSDKAFSLPGEGTWVWSV